MVLDDAGFKEVAFLFEVDHFAHPGERILFVREQCLQTNLGGAAVGNVAQVALEHRCIQSEHAAGEHAAAEADSLKLVQLWKNSTDKELKSQKRFCREIFETKTGRTASFQEFEISPDSPVYYTFAVQKGEASNTSLVVTGNPKTDEKLRKKSRLRDGETILILSRISVKSRETFKIYRQPPPYEELRRDALSVLNGSLKPISGISVSDETGNPPP